MDRAYLDNMRRFLARTWRVFWPVLRQVLGWFFIALGLVGLALPVVPQIPFLVIGIALVGRRNIMIRRARVATKRLLRRWAALPTPIIGRSGRMALRGQREFSRQARQLHRRYDAWAERRYGRAAGHIAARERERHYKRPPEQA
jgi:hypothetical protein